MWLGVQLKSSPKSILKWVVSFTDRNLSVGDLLVSLVSDSMLMDECHAADPDKVPTAPPMMLTLDVPVSVVQDQIWRKVYKSSEHC